MTRRSLLALGLTATAALFVVTGCGSDDSPGADTTTQVSAPQVGLAPFTAAPAAPLSGAPIDRDGLQRATLTLSELPADFDVVPDPVDDLGLAPAPENSEADKSSTDPAVCAQVLAPIATQAPGSVADLSDMFTGPDFTSIDQDSASYADGTAAAAAFEKLQTTLAGCAEYSGTDADGTTITYRVGGASDPNIGDASFAFRIITESGGFTLVADAIVAAVGTTLTQLSATAPSPIAPDVLLSMASAAADRLRAQTP
ncbi:sensor domain-containing protein [Rhodococcus sp. GOMB7]|uniref:sensor domain-containing protein n=1 Tax=Rhodococcus sp. GOMB7 TaxID=2839033 RepID=UPI0027E35285|nr:sensor domain-containing protein [Rhodococcus sp. GOMB7]